MCRTVYLSIHDRDRDRDRGGRDLFAHTHAYKVGSSGMRFSEGGQRKIRIRVRARFRVTVRFRVRDRVRVRAAGALPRLLARSALPTLELPPSRGWAHE